MTTNQPDPEGKRGDERASGKVLVCGHELYIPSEPQANRCVTHHYACDCHERLILTELLAAREHIKTLEGDER